MKVTRNSFFHLAVAALAAPLAGEAAALPQTTPAARIELEAMTWPELFHAIHEQGKSTVLVFNGGTEQRGPQAVTGGHTFIARILAREIAEELGNAIVAPVLPYSVNSADPQIPGTIGISGPLFARINEEVAEQLLTNGFKNVVLMGDHGGGQQELADVAARLDRKHSPRGVRIVFCGDVYEKAGKAFDQWLREHGLPVGSHASISDTSELLYLQGDQQHWVRKELLTTAIGGAAAPKGPDGCPVRNGISGDARRSSPEIGKRFVDLKVEYAVAEIRRLLAPPPASQ